MTPDEVAKAGEREGVVEAEIIEIIKVVSRRGAGITESPVRMVTTYFQLNGDLLYEDDKFSPEEVKG